MISPQLINFIQSELQQGKTAESIIPTLTANGWQPQDIQAAFGQLGENVSFSNNSNPLSKILKLNRPLLIGLLILFVGVSAVLGYWGYRSLFTGNSEKTSVVKESLPSSTPSPTVTIAPTQTTFTDCGKQELNLLPGSIPAPHTQLQCFIAQAKTCNSSKITLQTSIFLAGDTTSTIGYDIKKNSTGQCVLHLKQGITTHVFPTQVPQQDREETLKVLKKLENTEGICVFSNNQDVAEIFEKFDKFSFSTDTYDKGQCSGTYFDAAIPQ